MMGTTTNQGTTRQEQEQEQDKTRQEQDKNKNKTNDKTRQDKYKYKYKRGGGNCHGKAQVTRKSGVGRGGVQYREAGENLGNDETVNNKLKQGNKATRQQGYEKGGNQATRKRGKKEPEQGNNNRYCRNIESCRKVHKILRTKNSDGKRSKISATINNKNKIENMARTIIIIGTKILQHTRKDAVGTVKKEM